MNQFFLKPFKQYHNNPAKYFIYVNNLFLTIRLNLFSVGTCVLRQIIPKRSLNLKKTGKIRVDKRKRNKKNNINLNKNMPSYRQMFTFSCVFV